MAEKRVELPRGSTKRTKQPVQLTPAWFLLLLTKLPLRERLAVAFSGWIGPRISEAFGLKWQDLDLDAGVVTFRRGFVQGRITLLKTEASRTNLPLPGDVLDLLRQWRSNHSPSNAKRLGVRLALHQRRTSILACPTAQDSHQTGRSKSGFAEHRMAQFPPHGQRLGQRGRVATRRCQDPFASREHRNHLGHLWEFGHRSEANDSAKAGPFRQRAASKHYSVRKRDLI